MKFINPNRVYKGIVQEPYAADKDDFYPSHGWRIVLTFGYREDGGEINEVIDCLSQDSCMILADRLGLIHV